MTTALFHQPYEPYAYATTSDSVAVVLLVERGKAHTVQLHYGDRYQMDLTDALEMEKVGADLRFDYFRALVTIPTRRLKYAFEVKTDKQDLWYGEVGVQEQHTTANVFQIAYICKRDLYEVPDWVNNAVCYQIFPERFANGKPALTPDGALPWDADPTPVSMHGGDLPGITANLDHLKSLGVSLLYMTPIFRARSNHKYDTTDYLEIDPQFGTKEDFKTLVQEAHQRGIRVMLDAVFNHSGFYFGPFQDAIQNGRKSPYWNWFFIDGDRVDVESVNYETFSNKIAAMPKLNVANPEVEEYLLQVAQYWIREFGVDGWRLDVANEIDHVFWRKFREAVKSVNPEALIIGEVWHNSLSWLRGDEFDGVMNYVFREACLGFFVQKTLSAKDFSASIVQILHLYPEQATRSMFNLLGSHDTARILTLAENHRETVLLLLVFQFTYPGIPMLYYGDEVGMVGDTDPDCRRGMVWDPAKQDAETYAAVQALARLKGTERALGTSDLRVTTASGGVLAYERLSSDGKSRLLVVLNNSRRTVSHHASGELVFATSDAAVAGEKLRPFQAAIWRIQ